VKTKGFLLTRQWNETAQGLDLVYWIASENGPLKITLTGQEAVFFVAAAELNRALEIMVAMNGWRHAEVKLENFELQPVVAFYCKSQRLLLDARSRLMQQGITPLEADIRPTDRYLMERFITGPLAAEGPVQQATCFTSMLNPVIKTDRFQPALTIVSLDIETSVTDNTLLSVAVMGEQQSRVFMVGEERTDTELIEYLPDEKSVIVSFLNWIETVDPDVLIGWSVVNFDLWFLQERADRLRLAFELGRNRERPGWRRSGGNSSRRFIVIPGRIAMDGIELLRAATYNFESFSLEYVAQELLGRGKLIEDVDQRASKIEELFRSDKQALAEYNLEDCRLVWEIFKKTDLINFSIERARLTGLELERPGGSVAAFDYLYMPRLHRHGLVAPAIPNDLANVGSPGGYVLDSLPGIYDHVIVLDFKSLYPSIIRTFNVDPLAMIEAERSGSGEDRTIEGFEGARFSRDLFLLPTIIADLWAARDEAKRNENGSLSQAIKIIMNSFYGVLGSTGCRFFNPKLVSSITMRGHEIILKTRDLIEEKGYTVIYGDTDSVFIWLKGVDSNHEVDEIGNQLVAELNRWWREELAERFSLESRLELEFETHYSKFLMPTVRGSGQGSKKRYAGMIQVDARHYELVFKGLESVRSDWTQLARSFQQELYRRVFMDEPYEEFIQVTAQSVLNGECDEDLIIRKRLRRRLQNYEKNVPPHAQAAKKAERIRAQKGVPSLYADGGWIEYLMTVNGPEARQYRTSPIDYQFYIDKQLAPVADAILTFKSSSMQQLVDRQLGLF
jgi:DNA polymerase-2|tara:strand:- start:960 stop:3323 length:2364 start_codon:yes stop_codon:yes gene_type:complete